LWCQARLVLGLRHEVVCDVARRLSELAIQKKNYDKVRIGHADKLRVCNYIVARIRAKRINVTIFGYFTRFP
jgi:hypothetical protein